MSRPIVTRFHAGRFFLPALCALLMPAASTIAQKHAACAVYPGEPRHQISERVYGSSGQDDDPAARVSARRLGGNRMTSYNWENNASNAGADWYHTSDNYLTWTSGISPAREDIPGILVSSFVDSSRNNGVPSLILVPMAGYVARDKDGEVSEQDAAPSRRWRPVFNHSTAPIPAVPDTSDDAVYVDAFLKFLREKYDTTFTRQTPIDFVLDNEPEIWYSTHPRIHPSRLTCSELFTRSIDLAGTVKSMLPEAQVFGPAHYGFNAQLNLQDAPDWTNYRDNYPRFVDAYLDRMKKASDSAGMRLLDALDVHWYPDVAGVFQGDLTPTAVRNRVQVPRTLWDSSYVEDSWIGKWFSPVAMLPTLHASIDAWYPGTKLAIGEYSYGAPEHVSGGIAIADVLGIFGVNDVYEAHYWGKVYGYISSAFQLWRNYDNRGSAFPPTSIPAMFSDPDAGACYASVIQASPVRDVHAVLINRSLDSTLTVDLSVLAGANAYQMKSWRYFDGTGPALRDGVLVTPDYKGRTFTLTLPPLSAHHIVFGELLIGVEPVAPPAPLVLELSPNPASGTAACAWGFPGGGAGSMEVHDLLGRRIVHDEGLRGSGIRNIDVSALPAGTYVVTLRDANTHLQRLLHVVR